MKQNNFSTWLRMEAAVVLVGLLWAYSRMGGSWWWMVGLFLLPDLAMLGYLKDARVGAWAYNVAHSYAVALPVLALAVVALGGLNPLWMVWPVHIAFDRMMGYGLKSEEGFGVTHLRNLGGS
jgi:hypothetical protein